MRSELSPLTSFRPATISWALVDNPPSPPFLIPYPPVRVGPHMHPGKCRPARWWMDGTPHLVNKVRHPTPRQVELMKLQYRSKLIWH